MVGSDLTKKGVMVFQKCATPKIDIWMLHVETMRYYVRETRPNVVD